MSALFTWYIILCSIDQSVLRSLEYYTILLNVNLSALDGSGICDPCEKEPTDAICHMDRQQRRTSPRVLRFVHNLPFLLALHLIAWRSHLSVMGDIYIFLVDSMP